MNTTTNDKTIAEAGVHSQLHQNEMLNNLKDNKAKLLSYINEQVIGSHLNTSLKTVYGTKPFIYLDYTASGKPMKCIEDYLRDSVMPLYANAHSTQSASGKQTVATREEARHSIK